MSFAGMNYFAIVVAAVAGWFLGAAWYMSLAKPWVAALGKTMEEFEQEQKAKVGKPAAMLPFFLSFVAELTMAWILAGVLGHLGPGQTTMRNGIISAFFLWLGFVLTTMAVNNAFAGRKWALLAIDAGHWLAVMLLMGAIIGVWGV